MTIRKRTVVPAVLAAGALVMMVVASMANAEHVRPAGATPLRVSLVPSFAQCTTPNRAHGTPLAFPSCNPPVHTSNNVTVGEPTVTPGTNANMTGFVKLKVIAGVPGPPDDSDVDITAEVRDVRCKGATTACGNANAAGGADYTGQMQGSATIRITDNFNNDPGPPPGPFTDHATVVDIPFPVPATCANTGNTNVGGLCSANTSANATVAGAVKDGKRAVVEVGQISITDGGPDGLNGTAAGNTLAFIQGIFIP
jgi:hypothetical protein